MAVIAAFLVAGTGTALAGEVNGRGDSTPVRGTNPAGRDVITSFCAFSGLEDDEVAPDGPGGPGNTQTPHETAGFPVPPGAPADRDAEENCIGLIPGQVN